MLKATRFGMSRDILMRIYLAIRILFGKGVIYRATFINLKIPMISKWEIALYDFEVVEDYDN